MNQPTPRFAGNRGRPRTGSDPRGVAPSSRGLRSTGACGSPRNDSRKLLLAIGVLMSMAAAVVAHPVPRENHDRTIHVRLIPGKTPDQAIVRIDYRLEVDELTVVLDDMAPFKDEVDPARFKGKGLGYYAEYMRIYAPILARHLTARADGKDVPLTCTRRTPSLKDEEDKDLGHLRADFVFEGSFPLASKWSTRFEFRDGTYLLEKGEVRLHFAAETPWDVAVVAAPDEALQKRAAIDLRPGDDDRLRELKVEIRMKTSPPETTAPVAAAPVPSAPSPPAAPARSSQSLLRLLQTHEGGFWILLGLAGLFGAAHALTPGHGKTLVAAYLVGQRGTVLHAVMLGLVTTLTHTGAVLMLAGIIHFYGLTPEARAWIQASLPLVLGLMIVGFGFYLLLQRLAGRADHVHIGGGHHHHHHHHDGEHHHHARPEANEQVTWLGLVLLGMTGGIIPCWDAIVMLVWAIGMNLLHWALPMLLAFSAGLASVLVLLGILVVKMRGFAESRFGAGRWIQRLPLLSALAIIVLGFWLCFEATHPEMMP